MLEFKNVCVQMGGGIVKPHKKAILTDISFMLGEGGTIGIVGKSGSGKTTIANVLMRLVPFRRGEVLIEGRPVREYTRTELARKVQMVTQNPETSFDPDVSIESCFKEILKIHKQPIKGAAFEDKVRSILADVGLEAADLNKPPRRFSGGELQRLSIVRALLVSPRLLIFDEADSMLDTSIRIKLFDTLCTLRQKYNLGYLYITHDLRVLPHLVDTVLILSGGRMVEHGHVSLLQHSDDPFVCELRDSLVIETCGRSA